jgi:hypothetical protein
MFALDEACLTLSRNLNSQNNRWWCYKNPCAVYKIPLSDDRVRVYCAVSAHKIIGPAFFEEINSNHSIQLILTPLFRELTEEEKA